MFIKYMDKTKRKANHKWIITGFIIISCMLSVTPVNAAGITAGVISTVKGENNSQFVIHVSGVKASSGIQKIDCDVWSANNSQDDIKNYELTYSALSSVYSHAVNTSDHYNDTGLYYIDVYGTDGSGNREKIGDTYALIENKAVSWKGWYLNGGKIDQIKYTADLQTKEAITPSVEANNTSEKMKSGYGYTLDVNSTVTVSKELTAEKSATSTQNINTVFPEFNYKDGVTINGIKSAYNRLGVIGSCNNEGNIAKSTMNFKSNPFSTNNSPTHFTPLWYPDNTKYQVSVDAFDAWTPAGMLSTTVTPSIDIDSQVYDDWHIAPIK